MVNTYYITSNECSIGILITYMDTDYHAILFKDTLAMLDTTKLIHHI